VPHIAYTLALSNKQQTRQEMETVEVNDESVYFPMQSQVVFFHGDQRHEPKAIEC
jgi:hypothetical protein